ncbi:hypothetical protein SuNHUV7_22910 (plasmid) [Pseudoseohaeicola sp. NH-UV-7]|uniref:hypothetical protein n=1 Tax=unclassified Sulfitobacter TaxID=196795 RepID=UPI000E0B7A10|nr:hypothetical protein [Sulfitobacter sp. JL08]AXI55813.1 hypothetical protein C1J05_16065 [Sulfitobacter sp. JL08]
MTHINVAHIQNSYYDPRMDARSCASKLRGRKCSALPRGSVLSTQTAWQEPASSPASAWVATH